MNHSSWTLQATVVAALEFVGVCGVALTVSMIWFNWPRIGFEGAMRNALARDEGARGPSAWQPPTLQNSSHANPPDPETGRCSAARFKRRSESTGPVTSRRPMSLSTSRPRQPGGKLKCQLNVVRHVFASMGVI